MVDDPSIPGVPIPPANPDVPKVGTVEMPPTQIAMIGNGTGDGGAPQNSHLLVTPDGHPNVVITVITPLFAIFIRFVNVYLTTLLGVVTAGMVTNLIPATTFYELISKAAGLSIAAAGFNLLKDLVTVFGKLEQKFPLLTGNV